MVNPKISICLITYRPGGVDVLLAGLCQQEFDHNDFEVVLVDALYSRRHDLVADTFAQHRISLVHTPPRERLLPLDSCPQARNSAIAKANGELILWLVDYSCLPPQCLTEHWGVYQYFNKKRTAMGAHKYLYPPETAYELPDYAPIKMFTPNQERGVTYGYDEHASLQFYDDVEGGFYDQYMYSIFKTSMSVKDIGALHDDPLFFSADPKLTGKVGAKISGNFFHAKAETTKLDMVVAVNGFDEVFEGHLYDDTAMGHRLEHAGAEWLLLDPVATVSIVNSRHYFPHLVRRQATEAQRNVYEKIRTDSDVVTSQTGYSIAEMRKLCWWY